MLMTREPGRRTVAVGRNGSDGDNPAVSPRRSPLLLLLPVLGGLIGLAVSVAMPWPHGPSHSCPANGPQCFYPANLVGQRLLWTGIGLLAGLLVAALILFVTTRRPPEDPVAIH
jgi:hypothetical protein